jgi:uncharacterized protein
MASAPGSKPRPNRPPKLLFVLKVLAALYVLGTIFGGIGLGYFALHPYSPRITSNEERNVRAAAQRNSDDFRDVELDTSDGAVLRAWFLRPPLANGDAVILLHGIADNRLANYGFAQLLLQNHYAVLMPDARAHSLSTGIETYGLRESNDIHQWVEWLEQNDHPHCVFGLGESMGAAQLLESLPNEPRFCAVIAEAPFSSFREIAYVRFGQPFGTGPWIGRTFFRPTVDAGFLFVRWRYGLNMENASPERAVEKTNVPILLIHGLADWNIPPYHSDLIQAHNPSDITVWKVPGATHTQARRAATQEFDRRVLEWFEMNSNHAHVSLTVSPGSSPSNQAA